MADHDHSHDHAHHSHRAAGGALGLAAALTLAFGVLEGLGGWWAGSLALVSDAGHMLTDGAALTLGALAAWMAKRPPSRRHSYGLGRAEIFAALLNAGAMLAIVAFLVYESILHLKAPGEVNGIVTTVIAAAGLGFNLIVMRWLEPHAQDLNARAARLHVFGDALGSIAALVSGVVITLTGWTRIDPIASLLICVFITVSSARLFLESLHALMEGVPHGLSMESIGTEMAGVQGVLSVHDLHIWLLSGSRAALSAHIVVRSMAGWDGVLRDLRARLREKFGIDHVTLQPETAERPLVRVTKS